ncbi:MAG: acyl-ACP--UDP-N-acetylglucosamine O-acyltransferase [Sedimentisphaerales bacterium]|nr:acyl-ACP--UDP-N-acetylglucosamine O-acyltransferase [Sedimentisphaerales bacterium]
MIDVHPSAVVDETVQLSENVVIGPNCVVGKGVSVGSGSVLEANVVIGDNVKIGSNNRFCPNSVIGGRPQVLALGPDDPIGGLTIGNNNTFREQVTIHPSMHKDGITKIGNDNFLMIGVHIGHDCTLEDKLVLSNYAQVSGHIKLETGVWLSGMVLMHQFVTVGKWVYAAGLAGINHDVPPFVIVSGHYPPEVRGINKRGLSRAGLNEEQQKKIFDAYKRLYRNGEPLLETAKAMAKEGCHDENVMAMVEAIINSSKHRFGRYLETFRD